MANQREQVVEAIRTLLDRGISAADSRRESPPAVVDLISRFAGLRRRTDHSGKTSLASERGESARIATIEATASREAHEETRYIVALPADAAAHVTSADDWKEWLWPAATIQPTDIVYDCTEEILHGKAKPILCDLSQYPVRVFAILPTQLEQLFVRATQSLAEKQSVEVQVEFRDAGGHPIRGALPFHASVTDGASSSDDRSSPLPLYSEYRVSTPAGDARFQINVATPRSRQAKLIIRSQLNGLTAELPIHWITDSATSPDKPVLTSDRIAFRWTPHPWRL